MRRLFRMFDVKQDYPCYNEAVSKHCLPFLNSFKLTKGLEKRKMSASIDQSVVPRTLRLKAVALA